MFSMPLSVAQRSAVLQPAAASGPLTLMLDNFTDTNAVALPSHTISPTNAPAVAWVSQSGSNVILTNQAGGTNSGTANIDTCDVGYADVTLTGSFQAGATGASGFCARFSDTSNYWIIDILQGTGFRIVERNAGTNTQRAIDTLTINVLQSYVLVVVLSGTTITATIDGAHQISYASASLNQTATKHGIRTGSAVANLVDGFQVTTP